jgi:hypothetical protein
LIPMARAGGKALGCRPNPDGFAFLSSPGTLAAVGEGPGETWAGVSGLERGGNSRRFVRRVSSGFGLAADNDNEYPSSMFRPDDMPGRRWSRASQLPGARGRLARKRLRCSGWWTRCIAAVICKPVRPGQCRTRQDSNGHICDFEAVVLRIDGVEDSGLILRLRVAGLDRHANRQQGFKERGWLFHGVDGWRVKRRPVP